MEDTQGFFLAIPSTLFEESSGNIRRATLFGVIFSLSNNHGYCFASNEYLAQKLCLSKKSKTLIPKYLTWLEKNGWIKIFDRSSKRKIIALWSQNAVKLAEKEGTSEEEGSTGIEGGVLLGKKGGSTGIEHSNIIYKDKYSMFNNKNQNFIDDKNQSINSNDVPQNVSLAKKVDIFKVGKKIKPTGGNKDVVELINYISKEVELDGAEMTNRRYAWQLIQKVKKSHPEDYMDEIKEVVDKGLSDKWHKDKLTTINYLYSHYNQLKNLAGDSSVFISKDKARGKALLDAFRERKRVYVNGVLQTN